MACPLFRSYQRRLRPSVTLILRLNFAPLLAPQPSEIGIVIAHNHPGIRAADEKPSIEQL
jgi:hypothetical protein